MTKYWKFRSSGNLPVVAAAIHTGHRVPRDALKRISLSAEDRLREEDPFTGYFTRFTGNRIVAGLSRFAVDLNRPRDAAVYLTPEQSWGLPVWREPPAGELLDSLLGLYDRFYEELREYLAGLVRKHGRLAVLDIHSYNHRRGGSDAEPDDPADNPVVNIGTRTVVSTLWESLIQRFMADLMGVRVAGGPLDVRENVKFGGGYVPRWIHENFHGSVCVLSVELKKIFMDEWTGRRNRVVMKELRRALESTVPGLVDEITRLKGIP